MIVDLAPRLRQLRLEKHLRQDQVAALIGIDKSTVSAYENDLRQPWGHIITVLSRFVDAQDYELQYIQYDGWALDAVKTAVALGWIEDSVDFNPDKIISRGEFVELVNSVIETYR